MNVDDFAAGVVGRLTAQTDLDPYPTFDSWRAVWFEAWEGYLRSTRATYEAWDKAAREEVAEFERRLSAGKEYPGVADTLRQLIREAQPGFRYWTLICAYLDADTLAARRQAAGAVADFIEATTTTLHYGRPTEAPTDKHGLILWADKWTGGAQLGRDAGALLARMRRIADKGSADPLDDEEFTYLLLIELRHASRCEAAYNEGLLIFGYPYQQQGLYHRKEVAILDALMRLRDAEQIGDTAGAEAAHRAFETAEAMFGGNVDAYGEVMYAPQLSEEQRAAWERWQAETNTYTVATEDVKY